MNINCKIICIIGIAVCLLLGSIAHAVIPPIPSKPTQYVVDLADVIDENTELKLDAYLQELEQKTTAQVVVLTILSLEGESLEEFSISTANDKWKLGQKGKDNGVLIVISVQDKKYRFEIGYGLEGILPDSFVGSIGRKFLVPYFQKGDYSTGIYKTTLAVINKIASAKGVEITGMPKLNTDIYTEGKEKGGNILQKIFALLFLFGAIILFIKNPRLFLFLLLASTLGGGRRGGWSGGGGFGGGGGGGFGGGGASGGW
jgi:uncharacterized protein